MPSFSERQGFFPQDPPIVVRHDAPYDLRGLVADLAYQNGLSPYPLRSIICAVLMVREDSSNWSEFPNVDGEARSHLDSCEWYYVYDVIENVYSTLLNYVERGKEADAEEFSRSVNRAFRRHGIGWQLVDGKIEIRGEEDFEETVRDTESQLRESSRATAARELREALTDLARRPDPDLTGAVQHALAAVECVARDITGETSPTLGRIIALHPDRFPSPLNQALEKLWGFASQQGRHLQEGGEPRFADAELAVHIAAAISRHLVASIATPM